MPLYVAWRHAVWLAHRSRCPKEWTSVRPQKGLVIEYKLIKAQIISSKIKC